MVQLKKGTIIGIQDRGSIWTMNVKLDNGKTTDISGDWRPMRDGLDSAFDISSSDFPYVSQKKIYENVIGQRIEFAPDPIFGAEGWSPLGEKDPKYSVKVLASGKIVKEKPKGWTSESARHGLAAKGIKTGKMKR